MKHPCRVPLPIPPLGEYWRCGCGDAWYVSDKGWISGPHWEPVSEDVEERIDSMLTWLHEQGWEMQPWQVRIMRTLVYQQLSRPQRTE